MLGKEADIERRKQLTNFAYHKLKSVFKSKHITESTKLRVFTALIESIFLYNSELWGTTKRLDDNIDKFQRKLLRLIFDITWRQRNWLSNEQLYNKYKLKPWSKIIAHRRLRFFGNVARLHDEAPAKIALHEALRHIKKPRGRQTTTLIGTLNKQLLDLNISDFSQAIDLAQCREEWKSRIASTLL